MRTTLKQKLSVIDVIAKQIVILQVVAYLHLCFLAHKIAYETAVITGLYHKGMFSPRITFVGLNLGIGIYNSNLSITRADNFRMRYPLSRLLNLSIQ